MNTAAISHFTNPQSNAIQSVQTPQTSLTRKTDSLAYRILHSPLFWTVAAAGTLSVCATIFMVPLYGELATLGAVMAVSSLAGMVTGFLQGDQLLYKEWFELSLLCVRIQAAFTRFAHRYLLSAIQERRWHDQIEIPNHPDKKLFLSAIPLATMNHHEEIVQMGAGKQGTSVLTVLEPFENHESSLVGDPVRPEDWRALNVEQKQIPISDLQPIPANQIEEGVDFIHKALDIDNRAAVVHCKAGRGRSGIMVIGYMMKYHQAALNALPGTDFVEKAIQTVSKNRPQITLSSEQRESLHTFAREKLTA